MAIPKGIHLQRFDGGRDLLSPKDNGMLIVDGEIMFGVVDKKTVGATGGGLIHTVMREKGPKTCAQLFSSIQKSSTTGCCTMGSLLVLVIPLPMLKL